MLKNNFRFLTSESKVGQGRSSSEVMDFDLINETANIKASCKNLRFHGDVYQQSKLEGHIHLHQLMPKMMMNSS